MSPVPSRAVPSRAVPSRAATAAGRPGTPRRVRLAAALLAAVLPALAGCGGDGSGDAASASAAASSSSAASASASASSASPSSASPSGKASPPTVVSGDAGVKASGGFGKKPTLTVPDTTPPKDVTAKVLSKGDGPQVRSGETIVVNYLGQTWEPKGGAPNVFDNSYDRGNPTGFPIGVGRVIPGWDATLVGQRVGSRVVMVIPPEQAYGTDPKGHQLGGQTLIFVVDVVGALAKDATADGTPAAALPAGYPTIDSQPGKQPSITSVSGVKVPKEPTSALLLNGTGAPIEAGRVLALQIVQTDVATGKQSRSTFDNGPELVPSNQVFGITSVFKGAKVGSRAVTVTPNQKGGTGSIIAVIDVVGQY